MRITSPPSFVCPHDGAPLTRRAGSYVCATGHTFDRAREGYVNLLLVQDKASRDPGDSKTMVAARRRFLETGAYAPIVAATLDAVVESIATKPLATSFSILDAGCGEGYYLEQLAAQIATTSGATEVQLAGIDISKWAVRAAAKRVAPVAWAVASNRRPPVAPASTDLILCLFGFPIWSGFASIQPPGGQVILIDPGPDHLLEMRKIIYPDVQLHNVPPAAETQYYEQINQKRVQSQGKLTTQNAIADLLSMTPHAHRATVAGRAALALCTSLVITIDVVVRLFRRTSSH